VLYCLLLLIYTTPVPFQFHIEFHDYTDPRMASAAGILLRSPSTFTTRPGTNIASPTPSPTPLSAAEEDCGGGSGKKPVTPTTAAKQLRFVDTPPQVYAYLDEQSESADTEGGQWCEGSRISFDAYQRMLQNSHEETTKQFHELSKWREQLQTGSA